MFYLLAIAAALIATAASLAWIAVKVAAHLRHPTETETP